MHIRTFTAHLKRAFTTPMLYICILLYAAMLLGTTFGRSVSATTLGILVRLHNDFCRVISTIIPALAYAITYVDDYDNKLMHHWTVRSGVRSYAVSYYAVSVLAGFVVSFAAISLFIGIMTLRGYPLDRDVVSNVFRTEIEEYEPWYLSGHLLGYTAAGIAEYALGCGAMAGFAAACSALLHRRVPAVVVPVLYFYVNDILRALQKYITPLQKVLTSPLGRITDWWGLVDRDMYVSPIIPLPWHNLGFKFLLFLLYVILFGGITVCCIERSAENA